MTPNVRPESPARGHVYADPNEYQVLLCTSAVEIGVTFSSTLMFIEPGFNIAGFVQRVGRVARGATAGQVLVSLSARRRESDPWVREMADLVKNNSFLTVQEFAEGLLRSSWQMLEAYPERADLGAGKRLADPELLPASLLAWGLLGLTVHVCAAASPDEGAKRGG